MSLFPEPNLEIPYLQYLDDRGVPTQALPRWADDDALVDLYKAMSFLRQFDAKAVALQRTGKMGTFPSSLGQEAFSIGIGHAMREEDVFCPYYREQGTMMARGVKPEEILAYWGGDERGSCFADPRVKHDLPISVPIASQALHAVGIAYAMRYRNQPHAVVTTCGEGGTSKGDFYEALNFAGVQKLPVVFMVNNNQWAISVPRHEQTAAQTIAQKAYAGGLPGIQVDGNDVIAVAESLRVALERASTGAGPALIEALTFRLCDHTTADDATRYIPEQDTQEAWTKEPLLRLKTYLVAQGYWSDEQQAAMEEQCRADIASAVEKYEQCQTQGPETAFDHLYAELPATLISQRDAIMQEDPHASH